MSEEKYQVEYTCGGGYKFEKEESSKVFVKGQFYELEYGVIYDSRTELKLAGVDGMWNSCLFNAELSNISEWPMMEKDYYGCDDEDEISEESLSQVSEYLVEYTGEGGWDAERQRADKVFVKGQFYEVEAGTVHGWSTDIKLMGIDGRWNNCLFDAKLEKIGKWPMMVKGFCG